jgi:hypothetical protein
LNLSNLIARGQALYRRGMCRKELAENQEAAEDFQVQKTVGFI